MKWTKKLIIDCMRTANEELTLLIEYHFKEDDDSLALRYAVLFKVARLITLFLAYDSKVTSEKNYSSDQQGECPTNDPFDEMVNDFIAHGTVLESEREVVKQLFLVNFVHPAPEGYLSVLLHTFQVPF